MTEHAVLSSDHSVPMSDIELLIRNEPYRNFRNEICVHAYHKHKYISTWNSAQCRQLDSNKTEVVSKYGKARSTRISLFLRSLIGQVKGKVIFHPRTGHEGPEGELRYSSTLSLTSLLDGMGG